MQQPLEFYTSRKLSYELELSKLRKKLAVSSTIRLVTFLFIVFGVYLFFGKLPMVFLILGIGISVFLYLLFRHSDLQHKYDLNKALVEINKTELNVLNRDYFSLDDGKEFKNPKHSYSYDIDLFGRGSFFQYCNRTATVEGKYELYKNLTENNIFSIEEKQQSIKELSDNPKWRQHFSALASLVKVQHSAKEIISWIHNYTLVFPKYFAFLPAIFSIISLLLIILVGVEIIPGQVLLIWFFIGLGISGTFFKKVNELSNDSCNVKDTFKQYHKLLNEIENISFKSSILRLKQQEIKSETEKASLIFKKYSKLLDALDQRNNLMIGAVGNGLFLRDLYQVHKIEKWINTYKNKVEAWFKVISFIDAQNSLANFAFNHPEFVFPEIIKSGPVINATQLGHPLLNKAKRINSDLLIDNEQFFIVTGANMAGKSTFLRTVSLHIVMANVGLPVCAKSSQYFPVKLITSMRTNDSLSEESSYFFSELKRLKYIVDAIKKEPYFIVLDEILKGTNSKDKAMGSRKFVEKLVKSGSAGIIATHDLSLCDIEKIYPQIHNQYFDAKIKNEELFFDYKLKLGVCQNMNASFLLKKMKII